MSYTRELSDGTQLEFTRGNAQLGELGWTVRYFGAPEGHEQITRAAIGPARTVDFSVGGRSVRRVLTPAEINKIIEGNRDTDLHYLQRNLVAGAVATFLPADQKHHSLRSTYGQSQSAALADVVGSLRAQHAAILADRTPLRMLFKIGHATHLVQDSFSPAHTERHPGTGWCVAYVRNYGRGGAPAEHRVPSDDRDRVARSGREAAKAIEATRRYLQIVFKALYGRDTPDPVATSEAAREFGDFLAAIFRSCLRPGPTSPGPSLPAPSEVLRTGRRIVGQAAQVPGEVVTRAGRAAESAAQWARSAARRFFP